MKDKAGARQKSSARAGAAKKESSVPAPSAPDELQQMKDELQVVNQRLSKIGRVTRPGSDAARRPPLPEKQDLLARKADLERKIRAVSKPA